jgi:poly [ADP-ribose] polymerase
MSDDLPYAAEYAKSGRASCKGCKSPIAKDTLRLAVMVQVRSLGVCSRRTQDT